MKRLKGFTSVVVLFSLIITAMFISLVSTQIGRAYISKCYSQTTADAVSNAIATYSSTGSMYDITLAEEMFNKMRKLYPEYTLEWNKDEVSDNHIIIKATRRNAAISTSFFKFMKPNVSSTADVELVPQSQLAKIKSAFPQDKRAKVNPFVHGSPSKFQSNDRVLYDALLTQFYTEGRNRYRFTGEQTTTYGTMDAYNLLIADVLSALGYSPYASGFTSAGPTNGKGSSKPLTDGYVYIGTYKGHPYIVSNVKEKDTVTVLYLDETKEDAMSKLEVGIGEISNLKKSPTKWYVPKNEEEINIKENTTYFK